MITFPSVQSNESHEDVIVIYDGRRRWWREKRVMGLFSMGILIGLLLGLLFGFLLKTKQVVMNTHFFEKLYQERQAALAIAAEATNAYNNVGGRKNNKNRRIITPTEFEAHVGSGIDPRRQATEQGG